MIQVGDRVLCVDAKGFEWDDAHSLPIEGREYVVYRIDTICRCGPQFDIGLTEKPLPIGWVAFCSDCGTEPIPTGTVWVDAWRFRKVEERTIEYTVDVKIEIPEPCLS